MGGDAHPTRPSGCSRRWKREKWLLDANASFNATATECRRRELRPADGFTPLAFATSSTHSSPSARKPHGVVRLTIGPRFGISWGRNPRRRGERPEGVGSRRRVGATSIRGSPHAAPAPWPRRAQAGDLFVRCARRSSDSPRHEALAAHVFGRRALPPHPPPNQRTSGTCPMVGGGAHAARATPSARDVRRTVGGEAPRASGGAEAPRRSRRRGGRWDTASEQSRSGLPYQRTRRGLGQALVGGR